LIWLVQAGRGWGKSRTGAECIRKWVEEGFRNFALVGATPHDVRNVMIESEAGLLNVFPPNVRPRYESSKRKLIFNTGAVAHIYSAHKKDDESGLRGPQHEKAWGDEPQKWKYPGNYDQLMFGLRAGKKPQAVLTLTPRPIPLVRKLISRAQRNDGVVRSHGASFENVANLPDSFINEILKPYEGTRLGRQEIEAQLLEDIEGALWKLAWIERDRVTDAPDLDRIVVGVDPSANRGEEGLAETGITVGGSGIDGHGYLLDDSSLRGTPGQWAEQAVAAYRRWKADCIVAEVNNGGEMVRHTIHSVKDAENIPVRLVHASRGKYRRAEPISLLSERGMIHHVGAFAELEDQLTTWKQGDESPDRLDAYVWMFTELLVGRGQSGMSGGGDDEGVVETTQHGEQVVDEAIISGLKRNRVSFPGD